MPHQRQVIRKVQRQGIADFDDQMWPINCALIVLAGFVAGIIIVHSDFDTPRLIYNGWARLVSLAGVMGLAIWGMLRLEGTWSRRMQLAVLLSLLVHLWLGMYLKEAYLAMVLAMESRQQETIEEQQIVTTYDYDFQTPDQIVPDETLAEPVPATTPDVRPREVTRREMVSMPSEVQPTDAPARTQFERPNPAQIERAEVSAPRRSDAPAGVELSRSDIERALSTPTTALPDTELAPRPERSSNELQPSPLEPSRARPETARRTDPSRLPDAQPVQPRPTIERRQTRDQAERREAANPSPQRQLTTISPTVDAAESLPRLDSSSESQTARRAEAAVAQLQRQAASPAVERPQVVVERQQLTANPTISAPDSPAARRADRPDPTATARASATRPLRSATLDTAQPAEPMGVQSPNATPATSRRLEAAVADLARGRSAPAPSAALPVPAAAGAARAPQSLPAMSQLRRAQDAGQPSVAGDGAQPTQLARTQGIAQAAAVPLEAVRPSPGAATAPDDAPAEPPRTGVARASGGVQGLTRQRSFDLDLPSAGQASNIPTAAARRNHATDASELANRTSPSRPARIARARAGAEVPTAALRAEDVPTADAAGSDRPAEIEASASAAVERVASSAPSAPVTAAVGSSTIDFGPPQANAGTMQSRATGGGEPTIATQSLPTRLARAGRAGGVTVEEPLPVEVPHTNTGGTTPGGGETAGLESQAAAVARGAAATPATRLTGGPAEPATTGGGADVALGHLVRATLEQGQPNDAAGQPASSPLARQVAAAPAPGDIVEAAGEHAGESPSTPAPVSGPAESDVAGISRTAASPAGSVARPSAGGEAPAGPDSAAASAGSISTAGPRRAASGDDDQPAVRGDAISSAPSRRPGPAGLPSGAFEADLPGTEALASADSAAGLGADGPSDGTASPSRQASGPPVRIAAQPGPGGLTTAPAAAPGLPSRRARPESEVVHTAMQRFVLERAGGTPIAIDATTLTGPVAGFRQREQAQREQLLRRHGGTEGSERAVEMGLDFLARHQLADGRWSLHNFAVAREGYSNDGAGDMQADTAATGLALLSFFGAGYTHTEGKYRLVVRRGLDHLLSRQKADGDLFVPQDEVSARNVWLYSHGIASIALCEAYGMTRDPELRAPAQRALDFIVAAQHEELGGWRYSPRAGADTSVSGWQVMALKSGQLAGLEVPADTYAGVLKWLQHAQGPQGNPAYYAYRPRSNQRSQNQPSRAMTAEALLMRQYLGWNRENPHLVRGADYLKVNLPTYGSSSTRDRDAYYWYYATQVMFQMQGHHWEAWNEALRPLLQRTQIETGQFAGSWDPAGAVPDRWGGRAGRIYIACLHLLMLEVYYRHLPLYQDLN